MATACFKQEGQLGEIVIDNPPSNLFSTSLIADLTEAARQAAQSDARALVLRASGPAFSTGADVSIFAGLDETSAVELMVTVQSLIQSIEALTFPTVALVHGRCFAGALEVSLACDLIWAAAGTQMGQLEALVGAFPFAGGTQRLAARIGASRAAEMVLSAGIYPAEQMQDWGLVNRVVSADRLQPEGREFANTLALGPPLAHQATKRILRTWQSEGIAGADQIMRTEGTAVILSTDLQAGVASLTRSGPGHAQFTGN